MNAAQSASPYTIIVRYFILSAGQDEEMCWYWCCCCGHCLTLAFEKEKVSLVDQRMVQTKTTKNKRKRCDRLNVEWAKQLQKSSAVWWTIVLMGYSRLLPLQSLKDSEKPSLPFGVHPLPDATWPLWTFFKIWMFFLDTFAARQTVMECMLRNTDHRLFSVFVTELHLLTQYAEQPFNIHTKRSTTRCNIVTQYYWPSKDTLRVYVITLQSEP
jgi:hypothetical protein